MDCDRTALLVDCDTVPHLQQSGLILRYIQAAQSDHPPYGIAQIDGILFRERRSVYCGPHAGAEIRLEPRVLQAAEDFRKVEPRVGRGRMVRKKIGRANGYAPELALRVHRGRTGEERLGGCVGAGRPFIECRLENGNLAGSRERRIENTETVLT